MVGYVFVDLRGGGNATPVCYIVPSADVRAYCVDWAATAKMVRWHRPIAEVAPYRDAWEDAGSVTQMQAACAPAPNPMFYVASFGVPGLDPMNTGEVSARICGEVCSGSSCILSGQAQGLAGVQCSNAGRLLPPARAAYSLLRHGVR